VRLARQRGCELDDTSIVVDILFKMYLVNFDVDMVNKYKSIHDNVPDVTAVKIDRISKDFIIMEYK
jgi:hypothetical protein